jgi:hypothetical protein
LGKGRLDWEFESGERAIHVDSAVFKDGKADRLNRRLYRAVDVDLGDEETERKQDIQDLNLGIMKPEEYRAKWYGEDEQTAKKNLPQPSEVMQ